MGASWTFTDTDQVMGVSQVTITSDSGYIAITKGGVVVPSDSPEADSLLAKWARLRLGGQK